MHKVILIMGRTCSGKSTLARYLSERFNFSILKSYTTRSPRPGEEIQSDHLFISPEEVEQYKDRMIAYTKIGDVEYFATIDQLMESDIYVIDYEGFLYLKERLKAFQEDLLLIPIMISAPKEVRQQRFLYRGSSTVEEFNQREQSEDTQFSALEKNLSGIVYQVVNQGGSLDDFSKVDWTHFINTYNMMAV